MQVIIYYIREFYTLSFLPLSHMV